MKRIAFSALATLSIAAGAQNLSTEITVDRTIVPEEQTATPLPSVRPSFVKPLAAPTVLNPTEYIQVTDYNPQAGLFDVPVYDGVPRPSDFRGYVRAGYFPTYNVGVDFGYRVLADAVNRLGVGASFTGSSYNSHDVESSRAVADNTLGVQADYAHNFTSGAVLALNVDYLHSALKSPTRYQEQQKQNIDAFRFSVDFGRRGKKFSYTVGAYFDRFGMREDVGRLSGAKSNLLGLRLKGDGAVTEVMGYSLAVNADLLMGDGFWWRPSSLSYEGKKKIGNLAVNPALHFSSGNLKARVGAVINYSKDFNNGSFHAAPDVVIAYMPAGAVTVFAQLGGGEDISTLRSLYNYSPFAVGGQVYGLTFTKIDGRAGFTVGPFSGLSLQLYGRYTAANDVPMLVRRIVTPFDIVNLTAWSAGAKFAYRYGALVSLYAEAQILPNSLHHGLATVLDRASFILNANLRVRPIEKLTAGLGYEYRGGRRYYEVGIPGGYFAEDMGAVNNLSVFGEYSVTDALAVGLHLENLLCKRPTILPGISAQGLHGLLSVTYRF